MAIQAKIKNEIVNVGDLVQVFAFLKEGEKVRTQVFEGLVISIKGRQENKMFTVRKIATGGVGVERIWPIDSPWIEKIEIKKRGRVRRSKLYYLRDRIGKAALKVKVELPKSEKPKKPKHLRGGRVKRSETSDSSEVDKNEKKDTRQVRRKKSPKASKK